MPKIHVTSPDQSKSLILDYEGEVRFSPALFRASSTGFEWPLASAMFGEDVHWSADSRYVVVLAFNSTNAAAPPDVNLFAIDAIASRAISIDHNIRGLISQIGFLPTGQYTYRAVDHGVVKEEVWIAPKA